MNERIKELEVEAYAFANAIVFPDSYVDEACNWQRRVEFNRKFAELIVEECCSIFVELRTRPADLAVLDVKKHFGVE